MKIDEDYVFPVYMKGDILNKIQEICKKNEHEVFGYLVGERFHWKDQQYIVISDYLYLEESSFGSEFTVMEQGKKGLAYDKNGDDPTPFNFMEYAGAFEDLKKTKNNDQLLRLGWFHSHPDFGCFLSGVDMATQRGIFNESYHVALVVDPIREEMAFFTLDEASKKGYKELHYAIIGKE